MRELNECTQEVFRRSERRIEKRRKSRARALALCIPICLLAAAWSVTGLPAWMPEGVSSDYAPPAEDAPGNFVSPAEDALGNFACPYAAVEIQAAALFPKEPYGTVTDRLAVAEIYSAVNSLFADADSNDRYIGENPATAENNVDRDLVDAASEAMSYTIVFTAEDGSRAMYDLSGNVLENMDTNETVLLSEAQLAGLMAVLSLSEKKEGVFP